MFNLFDRAFSLSALLLLARFYCLVHVVGAFFKIQIEKYLKFSIVCDGNNEARKL